MSDTPPPGGPDPDAAPSPRGDSPRSAGAGRRVVLGAALVALLGGAVALVARPRTDPDALWRSAQLDLQQGRIAEAQRAADRLARLRPPTESDRMLQAQVAIAGDRIDEALGILDGLPDASPLGPQARLLAGQLELRRHRLRIAEEHLREALALDPMLTQARRELIYIYGYRSESEGIEEQFRRLAESGPLSPDDAFLWSLIRGVQWSPEEVVDTLSRAVAADPEDARSRIALADALLELTRFEEAEAILGPLAPTDPDSRAAIGRLALERGDVAGLRRLLDGAPEDHAGLALLRGKLALQSREPEAAIAAYERALELRPNDRDALSGLGQALNQSGRREEAAEVVERLNRVNALNTMLGQLVTVGAPRGPDQYVALGEACEAIGFLPQARAWYQNAISADPFHRRAQEALARLGRVGEEGGGGTG